MAFELPYNDERLMALREGRLDLSAMTIKCKTLEYIMHLDEAEDLEVALSSYTEPTKIPHVCLQPNLPSSRPCHLGNCVCVASETTQTYLSNTPSHSPAYYIDQ